VTRNCKEVHREMHLVQIGDPEWELTSKAIVAFVVVQVA
jgi:hypothetical protein